MALVFGSTEKAALGDQTMAKNKNKNKYKNRDDDNVDYKIGSE